MLWDYLYIIKCIYVIHANMGIVCMYSHCVGPDIIADSNVTLMGAVINFPNIRDLNERFKYISKYWRGRALYAMI